MKATHFIIPIYEVELLQQQFEELKKVRANEPDNWDNITKMAKLNGKLELLNDAKQIAYTEIDLNDGDSLFEQIAEITRPRTGNDLTKIDEL